MTLQLSSTAITLLASSFSLSLLLHRISSEILGVIVDVTSAVTWINSAVAQVVSTLGCPRLSQYDYDDSQLISILAMQS